MFKTHYLALLILSFLTTPLSAQSVELLAVGAFPREATDLSSLSEVLETGTPANQLGGFSAIEYTGENNRYLVLSDRGPGDGAASYACRFHEIELSLDMEQQRLTPHLLKTTLLRSAANELLSGSLAAVASAGRDKLSLAHDSEGLRLLEGGTLVISEEYGPSVTLFSRSGQRLKPWTIPSQFKLCSDPDASNAVGTFPNRGLEGLATSTDGQFIIAAMQGPLIQDGRVESGKCLGTTTRWLCLDRRTGETHQWLYPLCDESSGVSEILAVDETHYLVLERDSLAGAEAQIKRIYLADVQTASDISQLASSHSAEEQGVQPITKRLLIDLLDERFGLGGARAAEKPEGLCWGASLPDGRRMLVVCMDNDFESARANEFIAFAVGYP